MSGYIGTQPVPQATQTRDAFTATSGQTSFATSGYTPNFLDVFLNGVKLSAADYTASNGSDVVLATGAATGDILEVVAYTTFDTANVTGAANFTVTGSFTSQGIDDNANATAITIDSSENVGIGTSSPSEKLTIQSGNLNFMGGTNDAQYIKFGDTGDDDIGNILYYHGNNNMVFTANASEAMRISSGSLLVGQTTGTIFNSSSVTGLTAAGSGSLQVAGANATVIYANRQGSDGAILGLYKAGSAVGSIFSGHGGSQVGIGTNTTGITFNPATRSMMPANPSSTSPQLDATLDIGFSSVRWKDLYLSGGVYLGGTGAANKLDDYEEGTWTPVLKSDSGTPSGQVYGIQLGTYTKIGRSVHVQAYVSVTNMGSGYGGTYAQLHGLPFNIASGHQYFSSGSFPYVGALGQNVNSLHAYGQHGADYVYALYQNGAGVSSSYLSPAGWGSAPTIMFGMTYFTDA